MPFPLIVDIRFSRVRSIQPFRERQEKPRGSESAVPIVQGHEQQWSVRNVT